MLSLCHIANHARKVTEFVPFRFGNKRWRSIALPVMFQLFKILAGRCHVSQLTGTAGQAGQHMGHIVFLFRMRLHVVPNVPIGRIRRSPLLRGKTGRSTPAFWLFQNLYAPIPRYASHRVESRRTAVSRIPTPLRVYR